MGPTAQDLQWDNFLMDAYKPKTTQKFAPKAALSDIFWVQRLEGDTVHLPFQTIESSLQGRWQQDPWSGFFYFVELPKEIAAA